MTQVHKLNEDFGEAALRHFADAEVLAAHGRWGGAGYLMGFAAECGIKFRLKTLREGYESPHGHFPGIIETAKKHLRQRRDTAMHAVLKLPDLMGGWEIALRYSSNACVDAMTYATWRDHASRLISASGLRRSNRGV